MNPKADENTARKSASGRRRFLISVMGLLTLPALFVFPNKKDDIVIVNGWFLKRSDLDRSQGLARLVLEEIKPRND